VPKSTIHKWTKLYTSNPQSGICEADYLKLQKQLTKLEEDNAILKKVLNIFAKE
jgi:transposase